MDDEEMSAHAQGHDYRVALEWYDQTMKLVAGWYEQRKICNKDYEDFSHYTAFLASAIADLANSRIMSSQVEASGEYHIRSLGLRSKDYEQLRDAVHPQGQLTQALCGPGHAYYDFFVNSKILLPVAGALGKSVLDVIVDRVKEWLKNRPDDNTVEIFSPDNKVLSVVKIGQKITVNP